MRFGALARFRLPDMVVSCIDDDGVEPNDPLGDVGFCWKILGCCLNLLSEEVPVHSASLPPGCPAKDGLMLDRCSDGDGDR